MSIVVKPKKSKPTVPSGTYPATLTGVKQFQNAYGDRLGFEFTLVGGGVDGGTVMRSTTTQLTPRSKLADVVASLAGRDLTDAEIKEGLDLEQFIGNSYRVEVKRVTGSNGHHYANVERILQP